MYHAFSQGKKKKEKTLREGVKAGKEFNKKSLDRKDHEVMFDSKIMTVTSNPKDPRKSLTTLNNLYLLGALSTKGSRPLFFTADASGSSSVGTMGEISRPPLGVASCG